LTQVTVAVARVGDDRYSRANRGHRVGLYRITPAATRLESAPGIIERPVGIRTGKHEKYLGAKIQVWKKKFQVW
jgi:hypothetical protein